jgi:hypothetical protein
MIEIATSKEIGGATLICYLVIGKDQGNTGNTRHWVGGSLLTVVHGLAICKYVDDAGYYLFYCGPNWEVITDTFHESIGDAKEQAEFEFSNTMGAWIEQHGDAFNM